MMDKYYLLLCQEKANYSCYKLQLLWKRDIHCTSGQERYGSLATTAHLAQVHTPY